MTSGVDDRILRPMTLPLFLCAHLVYGAAMAFVFFPRMRAEGEVLGAPLLWTLVPVGLITAPLGAVLVRYAGGWFLHGLFFSDGAVAYERFHLAILIATGLLAGAAAVGGMFFGVAFISRDRPQVAKAPYIVAGLTVLLTIGLDWRDVLLIQGTHGRHLWSHPVGLVSLAVVVVLIVSWHLARTRLAAVPLPPGSRPSTPPTIPSPVGNEMGA